MEAWSVLYNNLTSLLQARSVGNIVSLAIFNGAWAGLAINYVHTLQHFGKTQHWLLAAMDQAALELCVWHDLPCYNATAVLQCHPITKAAKATWDSLSGDLVHRSRGFVQLTTARIALVHLILSQGCTVHYGDVDTVYVEPPLRNFGLAADVHDADMVAMAEGAINVGNYYVKSNGWCPCDNSTQCITCKSKEFCSCVAPHGAVGGCTRRQRPLPSQQTQCVVRW